MIVRTKVTVNAQEDVRPDAPATAPFAVNIGPGLPLEPGRRYTGQASIDYRTDATWSTAFITRQK
ncbi:hypothetical protein AB5J62_30800 [Amycolatopsis sp. cg5]|uniref:hypothetical protein n=1 Tax=Amycolatopsis sp. cg5 TaxID=3238802 RepID=UPI00352335C8